MRKCKAAKKLDCRTGVPTVDEAKAYYSEGGVLRSQAVAGSAVDDPGGGVDDIDGGAMPIWTPTAASMIQAAAKLIWANTKIAATQPQTTKSDKEKPNAKRSKLSRESKIENPIRGRA